MSVDRWATKGVWLFKSKPQQSSKIVAVWILSESLWKITRMYSYLEYESYFQKIHNLSVCLYFFTLCLSIFAFLPTQLFTATWARMALTTRCAQRTWHHSWRKRRTPWMGGLCCQMTTAQATKMSAPLYTSAVPHHIALSLSLSWHG